jgi:hypothetical protein
MTVTTISASLLARFQREPTVIFGFISFPDPSAQTLIPNITRTQPVDTLPNHFLESPTFPVDPMT